jgi:hypothetical protein
MATDMEMESARRLLLSAVLETPTARYPVIVRDLAGDTALVQGERLPRKGALICLRRGMIEAFGEVQWVEGDEAGVDLDEAVDIARFRSGGVSQPMTAPAPYIRPGLNRGAQGDVSDAAGSIAAGGGALYRRRDLREL